jgi:CRP-like cAMP-binding protein
VTDTQFQSAVPSAPADDIAEFWRAVRDGLAPGTQPPLPAPEPSSLEVGLSALAVLSEAPPRTSHSAPVVRSSPAPPALRAMLERREFGQRYDAIELDLDSLEDRLPTLECPTGDLQFLASDGTFEDLTLSVGCLLQHRRRLLAPSLDHSCPRRDVLVVGGGPGGLIAAIELRLRDHRVIVCEEREGYTRNRFMGVYKEIAHTMAALGMPERMTYDFTHYRGKRGIMVADIQTFLHAVALKLGVIIYTGAVAPNLTLEALRNGEIELQRSTRADSSGTAAVGVTRWHYDTVMRVRSGVSIRFDTIIEATGGRSGLRELIVGADNVVSLRTVAKQAALRDPSLDSYFDAPADHCAQIVESDYGCPREVRQQFAAALLGDDATIPDEIPCLVSNVDASIIVRPLDAVPRPAGMGARIGDTELDIPRDWVIVRCPRSDQTLTRYQIEGPLPQSFEFGGQRVPTSESLRWLNPVSLLLRIFYAIGVPFEAVDRRRLVDFYTLENTQGDASDVVATWVGAFRGLRVGGSQPVWSGRVPGSERVEYGIIGEALQNAWYRFGVGIDDTFAGAQWFARGIELAPAAREAQALRFEEMMTSRSVQVLYHLYRVNQNADQGVVGPVLTECHMERRYDADLAEAGLRQEARHATEMATVLAEVRAGRSDPLLEAALEHRLDVCCGRVLELLRSLDYDPALLEQATHAMRMGLPDWRARALATLSPVLAAPHRELLSLLAGATPPDASLDEPTRPSCDERLLEIGLGRYAWASPWVRACALRALDPTAPGAAEVLAGAASESDPCVAEAAREILATSLYDVSDLSVAEPRGYSIPSKVAVLAQVSLFQAIPHENLVGLAGLLADRSTVAGEIILEKGELGDCLYVVASGGVRVHDGERTLGRLGPSQFFGELSLLDAEPRVASVSALERTHLFRLEQADFYSLLAEQPQMVRAINRALCRMLRTLLDADTSADEDGNARTRSERRRRRTKEMDPKRRMA